MAPNLGMVGLLNTRTGRPSFPMAHGVDTNLFSPTRRNRREAGSGVSFRIGYVGRLTPEKNVRLLVDLERELMASGHRDFRFVMVGDGSEREWLRKHLQSAEFPGVLRDAALADVFANMDAFVFPSHTDTFGLVALEAMASGVPVVSSPQTASRVGIAHGVTGFHAATVQDYAQSVIRLMDEHALQERMGRAARGFALSRAWDGVFDQVYRTYHEGLAMLRHPRRELAEVSIAR